MSQDPLTQQLAKASGDVKKLCSFFTARKDWDLASDAIEPARDLLIAATTFDERLKELLRASDAETAGPLEPSIPPVDAGIHDGSRLVRFTTFLKDLDDWLAAQPGPVEGPDVVAVLKEMEAHAGCIVALVTSLTASPDTPTDEESPAPGDDATPVGAAVVDTAAQQTTAAGSGELPHQLVLDDTDETPLVEEFQGRNELTAHCKELVDAYLAGWGLEYTYYDRKKLLERLLRWIASAPEGQALVLKMKTIEEPYEPYPSYVSRDVLAGIEPEKDPWK